MAYWNNLRYQVKKIHNTFGNGINTGLPPFEIGEDELMYLRNMDSREYPAATVRPPRSPYATTLTTPNALGQRNNEYLHVVDGNTWKYWNPASTAFVNLTTSLSSTEAEIGEFATGTNKYTLLMNSTQKLIWDGTSTAINLGTIDTPLTKIFTVHKGRIYAARENDIKFCALNKTSDWTTANDAGSIDITRAKGNISGMTEYNDHVMAFTEYSMHELFGTGPPNYELIDVEGEVGCISARSITKGNRRLYWVWFDGVYEYDGASPVKISDAVNEYIQNITPAHKAKIVSGSIGDFLYIAIPYNSTVNNLVLKFDTRLRKWYVEDGAFVDFVTIGNVLYGVDSAGQIWNMRNTSATEGVDSATPISWSMITKPFNENAVAEQKAVTEMSLVVDRSISSTSFTIGYSTNVENNDSTSFITIVSDVPASSNIRKTRVQLPLSALQNVDWYRLRIAGTGQATVHSLQKNLRIKPR